MTRLIHNHCHRYLPLLYILIIFVFYFYPYCGFVYIGVNIGFCFTSTSQVCIRKYPQSADAKGMWDWHAVTPPFRAWPHFQLMNVMRFQSFRHCKLQFRLQSTNIAMENPAFEDVFPIGKGGFPLPDQFTGGYINTTWFLLVQKHPDQFLLRLGAFSHWDGSYNSIGHSLWLGVLSGQNLWVEWMEEILRQIGMIIEVTAMAFLYVYIYIYRHPNYDIFYL